MKKTATNDGSITFYSEKYEEHYHSVSGAEEEAIKKFTGPCRDLIINLCEGSDSVNILDICFGLGYNSAAAIDEIRKHSKDIIINIIALENDKEILNQIQNINSNFSSYSLIKELINNKDLIINKNNTNITIIINDARESIKQIKNNFDIIFLDPFSPQKCPELWTEEFFRQIKQLAKKSAVLTTYSCAKKVRNNLTAAGFRVKDGPCIGRKSPSTVAIRM